MYTLRSDGRYMGYWHELDRFGRPEGPRHAIYDRDPERLYEKILAKETAAPAVLTFGAAADAWEKKHWDRIGAKTAETYKAPLQRVRDHFGELPIEEITAQDIQAFLNDLGKRSFARRTVQMHRDIINMIFNDAIVSAGLRYNPCSAVAMPRNLSSTRRELPTDDAVEAVKASGGVPFGLFALIALYSGLRRGEILALRWEDVDRKAKLIHVTRAVEYASNSPTVKAPKTAAGVRDVPLLDPLAKALPSEGTGLIFPGRDSETPLTKTMFRKRWLRYCETIGHDVTAHQLRHGFATILYEAGVADKDAQELLGHSSIAVTRDVYTHIRQSQREATAKRLNDYLKPKPARPVVRKVVKKPRGR